MTAVSRAARAVRRHGPVGIARIAADRFTPRVRLDEEHIWYVLELAAARKELFNDPEGTLRLMEPRTAPDVAPFDELPTISAASAWERMQRGGRPWLVLDDARAAFACWTFNARAPMIAARHGWLALPDGAVVLEDSVAAPIARGRGIAPRTWTHIAAVLAADGVVRMLTKVETGNTSSRRAVAKAGFEEIAVARLRRRGLRTRVDVEVLGGNATGADLARRLQR